MAFIQSATRIVPTQGGISSKAGAYSALSGSDYIYKLAIILDKNIVEFIQGCTNVKSMNSPLIKEYHYNVPTEKVWEALIDKNKMKEWYFPQLQKFEPVVGYKFQFDNEGVEYQKEWIVTKVVPGKTVAHSWSYKGYTGSSVVLFDVSADGNKTILRVTQTGLESFPNHPHFKRERFEWGWNNLLGQNLKHLLENRNNS